MTTINLTQLRERAELLVYEDDPITKEQLLALIDTAEAAIRIFNVDSWNEKHADEDYARYHDELRATRHHYTTNDIHTP
jgi:hypothetical protein